MHAVRKRATFSNVVSLIALFAVLGGGAYAATKIKSKDLAKNAVTTKKIKNDAVTTKKIKNDAVTGDKVNESTLGQVPSAATAATAANAESVGGQQVTKVFAKIPPNNTQVVATFDSFVIRATCSAAGNVENLQVDPSVTDADLGASGNGDSGPIYSQNQGTEGNSISLNGNANVNIRGSATFTFARSGGQVATGVIGFDDTNSFDNESVCAIYGHVTISG